MHQVANNGVGSSPLARGTPEYRDGTRSSIGLIPARAGNTPGGNAEANRSGAHPRSRGEHKKAKGDSEGTPGSSPLARGTHEVQDVSDDCLGLIPARAGNTFGGGHGAFSFWAHPRSRGEHALPVRFRVAVPGSSPLARGTLVVAVSIRQRLGLIPARAGNTSCSLRSRRCWRAHPRSRGEHTGNTGVKAPEQGSSPLARGTPGCAGSAYPR